MPTPNYGFEKRQRELAKKKQKDEKEARKRAARAPRDGQSPDGSGGTSTPAAGQP